jgi:hypothetical protein
VIDGDFDDAFELYDQQIVDLTLEMHAKGVQDKHLLRGCFHPHYDLLQLVQLFLHSTHHHNHHVQLLNKEFLSGSFYLPTSIVQN